MIERKRLKLADDLREFRTENRLDPRQKMMWDNFINPASETFSNGYRSAIKAGYSVEYAKVIRSRDWFQSKMRRTHLLTKAEIVMNKILDMETDKADKLRVQSDVAKHISKTLGKDEGYSEKTEVVGGNPVVFLPIELMEKFNLGEKKDEQK